MGLVARYVNGTHFDLDDLTEKLRCCPAEKLRDLPCGPAAPKG